MGRRRGWAGPARAVVGAAIAAVVAGCGGHALPPSGSAGTTARASSSGAAPPDEDGGTGPYAGGRHTVPGTTVSLELIGFEVYVADDPTNALEARIVSDPALAPFATSLGGLVPSAEVLAVEGEESVSVTQEPAAIAEGTDLTDEVASLVLSETTMDGLPSTAFQAATVDSGIGAVTALDFMTGSQRIQDDVLPLNGGYVVIRTVVPHGTSVDTIARPIVESLQRVTAGG